ncbi:MAG: YggT family protein [Gammaproteobacteria bacterium]|nr:YggT family protein [Gammaproteobacteria bacterium]MDH5239713.1 YggT family protein [Gammaproteobacteria bacterium]MDH5260122.1 YggT family protein [Gammaproteobacteria bacterium]MDH5582263.1 YggT family protein [Gammaproteobacteria bacterium]
MPSNIASALVFIVNAVSSLYLLVLLLRFWLPWLRADFRNPLAQGILKLTSPVIIPVRRLVPSFGRLDTATILVAFVLQCLALLLILLILGASANFSTIAISALAKLVLLSVNLFMFAIFIRIVLSWIAPGQYNPATAIITTLTEPLLAPVRRIIPPLGGFDISPIFVIIALGALTRLLMGFNRLGL